MAEKDNTKFIRALKLEEKFFQHIDYGLAIVDKELKVHFWNSWLSLQSGIEAGEIEGNFLGNFFSNFNQKTLKRKIATSLSLNTATFYNASSSKYLFEFKQKKVITSQYDSEYMQQDVIITPYDTEKELVFIKIRDQSEISAKNRELKWLNSSLKSEQGIIDLNVLSLKIDLQYNINSLSTAYLQLMEYEKEDLFAENYFDINYFNFKKSEVDLIQSEMKKENSFILEHIKRTQSGRKVYLKVNYIPQYDEYNNFIAYMLIMQDETAKILLEQQQKMLLQQSRQAAMGEMISMIAHQWRQPLSVINTIIAGIRFDFEMNSINKDELGKSFIKIENVVQFLSSTINDFTDYFRPNKTLEFVALKTIIEKAVGFVLPLIEQNGITYRFDNYYNEMIEVKVPANELVQILINLMKNSLDAINSNNMKKKEIILSLEGDESYYIIKVFDSGGGIAPEIQEKIFEPYFSTKSKNGTGLGLYMAKMIIEDHFHGEIRVEVVAGESSTFILTIPIMH